MTLRISDLPLDERPRERLARHGAATLADAELLALVIGSGTRRQNALEVARTVLADGLVAAARKEWRSHARFSGIGEAHAAKIAAAFELGRRATAREVPLSSPIDGPGVLARALVSRYTHEVQERLGAVYFDTRSRVIRSREIYVGTLNSAVVSTRDILRHALDDHAASVIVFHNHPSGDPAPSTDDLVFTRRLVEAGKVLGIEVLDHLILGASRYVSLRDRGML